MSGGSSKRPSRVPVSREGSPLGEFAALQIPSLFETGYFRASDQVFDFDENKWVPVADFVRAQPGFGRRSVGEGGNGGGLSGGRRSSRQSSQFAGWIVASLFLVLAVGAGLLFVARQAELDRAKASLAGAEAEVAHLRAENNRLQLRASPDLPEGVVTGRMIVRDANNRRIAPPNVKIRLFSREAIEAHAAKRHAELTGSENGDENRLAVHFGSGLPTPILTTATDSRGRFEFPISEPGQYVIQASARSARSGASYTWFLGFDSRDSLNTPIDLNESNRSRQFHPLFLITEGR